MKDFKEFLLRGNLVTMAVAFVIGLAFADVIRAFVTDIITPILGVFGGTAVFSDLNFTINGSIFLYGAFFTAILTFVATAAAIFYLVVKPYNAFAERSAKDLPETEKQCPHCLSTIPVDARVCSFCTRDVAPASV